jgi:molecular chaperone GrpE
MMQEPSSEHPDNTVLKELQKGYLIHDRLLRPAMVIVSKDESQVKETKQDEED